MAYGIKILNIDGGTIFNSTNYVELGAHTGTVNSYVSGASGTKFNIPDYCWGMDQKVSLGTVSRQRRHQYTAYNNVYQIALYINISDVLKNYDTINYGGSDNSATVVSADATTFNPSSGVYYKVFTMSEDMSGIRTTSGSSTIALSEYKTYNPSIYIRPTSSSYSGRFWATLRRHTALVGNPTSDWVAGDRLNYYLTVHDSASGSNQFEVMVALPSYVWGGISGTKAHTSGTSGYGLQALSTTGQKHTPSGTAGQFTTFDSRGRPSKIILTEKVALPNKQVTNASMGSLVTSTTKRWCRMNGTELYLYDHLTSPVSHWHWMYKWDSNNSISLQLNNDVLSGHTNYGFTNTLKTPHFFAVANFGLGL